MHLVGNVWWQHTENCRWYGEVGTAVTVITAIALITSKSFKLDMKADDDLIGARKWPAWLVDDWLVYGISINLQRACLHASQDQMSPLHVAHRPCQPQGNLNQIRGDWSVEKLLRYVWPASTVDG